MAKLCGQQATIGGATYICGRERDHGKGLPNVIQSVELMHEAIGEAHPRDGETYIVRWISPYKMRLSEQVRPTHSHQPK